MEKIFTRIAGRTAYLTGKPVTFLLCVLIVVSWAVAGPFFGFSDTWQLVINTGTTIITFLMVFLIQNTQNRDGIAIQAKLDELIRANRRATDEVIGIEHLTEKEVEEFRQKLEDAAKRHTEKRKKRPAKTGVNEEAGEDGASAGGNAALVP
ncbi:MAG TPA: low affinity iron permease family protein [Rhizobiaceae bacterium]|nr:low affinity iron permease family protein [Rhizobiaceae bacterium]